MSNSTNDVPYQQNTKLITTKQKLLSRDEVEATYGISKRFLEIAACKGGGPAFVKVGRLTRYRAQDIEDWITQHRFSNTSEAVVNKGRL